MESFERCGNAEPFTATDGEPSSPMRIGAGDRMPRIATEPSEGTARARAVRLRAAASIVVARSPPASDAATMNSSARWARSSLVSGCRLRRSIGSHQSAWNGIDTNRNLSEDHECSA